MEALARKALLAIALLCGVLARAASAEPSSPEAGTHWHTFVSQAGRFQVELPVDPEEQVDPERMTLLGSVSGRTYVVHAGDLELAVEVRDIPTLAKTLVPTDVILDQTREGVTADLGAQEVEGSEISLQGLPARDFVYRLPGPPPVLEHARAVLVDGRLYLVTGKPSRPGGERPELERFLDSFRFTPAE